MKADKTYLNILIPFCCSCSTVSEFVGASFDHPDICTCWTSQIMCVTTADYDQSASGAFYLARGILLGRSIVICMRSLLQWHRLEQT